MNEFLLKQVKRCGCYYCMKLFDPLEIKEWVDDGDAKTAICPFCGIDSVLQESNDGSYELNETLLKKMYEIYFN